MAGLRDGNPSTHAICIACGIFHPKGVGPMAMTMRTLVLWSAFTVAAWPAAACDTIDDVVAGSRGEAARVTVIRESGELSRALSFMIANAESDEAPAAEALVVIEKNVLAEVVLIARGCATTKAVSEPSLAARMLLHARGREQGTLI